MLEAYLAIGGLFLICFLLGSIPWGVIISRIFFNTDVRAHGSGNIGTTNAIRTMGKRGGYAVFILDFGKGLLAGATAYLWALWCADIWIVGHSTLQLFYAVSFLGCVWGHIFCPWLKFRGGKGIAVAIGCLFIVFGPLGAVIELGIFAILVAATKYVSVGSIASALACPLIAYVLYYGNWVPWFLITLGALTVVWAHRENIKRLRAGTESRIGKKQNQGNQGKKARKVR